MNIKWGFTFEITPSTPEEEPRVETLRRKWAEIEAYIEREKGDGAIAIDECLAVDIGAAMARAINESLAITRRARATQKGRTC